MTYRTPSQVWASICFAANSGNAADEVIKQYIESQGENLSPEGHRFPGGRTLGAFHAQVQATRFSGW